MRCLVRASSDTSALERARRRARRRRPHRRRFARHRDARLRRRCALRRAGVRLGDRRGDREHQRPGHPRPARGLHRRVGAAVRPSQQHRRVRLSRRRAASRRPTRHPLSQLVRADQARGRGGGPPRRSGPRAGDRDPAPGDRLRTGLEGCRRRDRPRDPGSPHAPDRSAVARSPAFATSTTSSTPPSSRSATTTPPATPSTSATASTSPGDSSPTTSPPGFGCPPVRWSMPYALAHAIGFSLEHGYRLLRRGTGLSAPPLLSRQAVQVLGKSQDFSNRKLRETARLGAARGLPRAASRRRSRGCTRST